MDSQLSQKCLEGVQLINNLKDEVKKYKELWEKESERTDKMKTSIAIQMVENKRLQENIHELERELNTAKQSNAKLAERLKKAAKYFNEISSFSHNAAEKCEVTDPPTNA